MSKNKTGAVERNGGEYTPEEREVIAKIEAWENKIWTLRLTGFWLCVSGPVLLLILFMLLLTSMWGINNYWLLVLPIVPTLAGVKLWLSLSGRSVSSHGLTPPQEPVFYDLYVEQPDRTVVPVPV